MTLHAALPYLACAACATTTSVCPVGTNRVDKRDDQGRAQYCTTGDQRLAALPVSGRTFENVIGSEPAAMPGGVSGPFTSWYPNGTVHSHGHYVDLGSRSVPDGLWAFWSTNGQRRTLGRYERGQPSGCFAVWDERGIRSTGFVEGNQLHVEQCTPPPDDELAIVEGRTRAPEEAPAKGDVTVQAFFGPGPLGASNALQIDPEPSLQTAFDANVRARFGRFRAGPTGAIRLSGNTSYRGLGVGGSFAVAFPSLHPRLDEEAGVELGAQYITGLAQRPMQRGVAEVAFWSPLAAAHVGVAFALSPFLEACLAARAEGFSRRDVERDVTYCSNGTCLPPQRETWSLGGVSYGLSLGLRLLVR